MDNVTRLLCTRLSCCACIMFMLSCCCFNSLIFEILLIRARDMSNSISLLALCLASYTWWSQPPAAPPPYTAQTPPPSEFSCSARCPAPSATVPVASAPGRETLAFFAGLSLCLVVAVLYFCRVQRSPAPITVVQAPVSTEPVSLLAIEGPLTPAVRRQLRQQQRQNGA